MVNVLRGGDGAPLFRPPVFIVTCFWAQRVTKTRVWSARYLGIFQCSDRCGNTWLETDYYTEESVTRETYVQRWATKVLLPFSAAVSMASAYCKGK